MTLPNLITLLRLVLVPLILWCLLTGAWLEAFLVFMLAGVSDAIDGLLARWLDQKSELGTVLDPFADKVMLVSVFVTLTVLGHLPIWLTLIVVSRDILLVCGILITFILGKPIKIDPIAVSKATTLLQIVLAALTLGVLAFDLDLAATRTTLEWLTGTFTVLSALAYAVQGIRHLSPETNAGNSGVRPGKRI